MTTTTPYRTTVLPLAAATDHRIAGRKAATLARLAAAGFPVPPGVVYRLPSSNARRPAAAKFRPRSRPTCSSAVRGWGEVPLAVRSSGVEEDSADASYAGLFTTVLNVRGDTRCSTRSASAGTRHSTPEVTSYAGWAAAAAGRAGTADGGGHRRRGGVHRRPGHRRTRLRGDRRHRRDRRPARVRCGDTRTGGSSAETMPPGLWGQNRPLTRTRGPVRADLARRVEAELGGGRKTSSGPSSTTRSSCCRPAR